MDYASLIGSASDASLQRMPNTPHSLTSHNLKNSHTILESQESLGSQNPSVLDSEISESSTLANTTTEEGNSKIFDEKLPQQTSANETHLGVCRSDLSQNEVSLEKAELPKKQPQRCFYIGSGNKAYSFLNRLQADILVMTTPGLEVLHIRRNRGIKHYCHITHSLSPMTYRAFGVDYFDSVLVANEIQKDYVRDIESVHGVKRKYISVVGSPYLDELSERHSACGDFCASVDYASLIGSASDASLRRMSNTPHSLTSHNPKNSLTILECQESLPSELLDSEISESSSQTNTATQEGNSKILSKNINESLGISASGFSMNFKDYQARGEGSLLNINDRAKSADSLKSREKQPQKANSSIADEVRGLSKNCAEASLEGCRVSNSADSREIRCETNLLKTILISPSWGKETLLSKYGLELLLPLAKSSFHIIIRPHPQSFISPKERENIEQIQNALKGYPNIEWDKDTPNILAFERASMMISDFSSVIFDFVCLQNKPVLTIDNDMDFSGYDMADIPKDSIWTFGALNRIGGRLNPSDFSNLSAICEKILDSQSSEIQNEIQKTKEALWCYPHRAGEMAALELLKIEREIVETSLKPQISLVARLRALDDMIGSMSKKAVGVSHA